MNPKRIFLQIPEGLKPKAQELAKSLEKTGAKVFLSIEPCYGGCDIRDSEAERLGCDLIVHVGHSDFGIKTRVPVIYEEYRTEFDPVPVLEREIKIFEGFKSIGLITTVQYLSSLDKAKKFLEKHGKKIYIGKPRLAKYPGQILGCDYSSAKSVENLVDCYLYIGTGEFHPLGLAMETEKPVFFLNAESGKIKRLETKKYRILRALQVEKAKEAKNFGIFVSTKPGQARPELAERLKNMLEIAGKNVWILVADEISKAKLLGLNIEVIVNTACPRIRDDWKALGITVINPEDVEEVVKEKV